MNIFNVDTKDKKNATSITAYFCTFLYVMLGALLITEGFMLLSNKYKFFLTLGICLIVNIILLYYFCNFRTWLLNEKVEIVNYSINHTYNEVVSISGLANSTVYDKSLSISEYKVKKNKIVLYGRFTHKEPLIKEKELRKCTIKRPLSDEEQFLKLLDDIISVNNKNKL